MVNSDLRDASEGGCGAVYAAEGNSEINGAKLALDALSASRTKSVEGSKVARARGVALSPRRNLLPDCSHQLMTNLFPGRGAVDGQGSKLVSDR
jgi:hypothetical protein